MVFRDLKQNYPLFILNKEQLSVTSAKVSSISLPRFDANVKQTVVDVGIEYDGKSGTYVLPETQSISSNGNIVISTDQEGLSREVEAMKNAAEQVIASVPHQEEIIKKASSLLSELNPSYRKEVEINERFNKIETSISEMNNTFREFMKSLNEFKGGK